MWRKQTHTRKHPASQEYWQSYSDMMAALLLMFALLVAAAFYSYQVKQQELQTKQLELQAQKEELELQQRELEKVEKTLDDIVGVKAEIIRSLQSEFENAGIPVRVDEKTGDITLNESDIRFATAKAELSIDDMRFLDQFMPRYLNALLAPEYIDNISAIVIEGHTDSAGGYMYNLNLSQERAFSVANYCLTEASATMTPTELDRLQKILTANGRSYSDRIYKNDGTEDMDASRRVVFKFRLKDDSTIEKIRELIANDNE